MIKGYGDKLVAYEDRRAADEYQAEIFHKADTVW